MDARFDPSFSVFSEHVACLFMYNHGLICVQWFRFGDVLIVRETRSVKWCDLVYAFKKDHPHSVPLSLDH